MFAMRNSKVKEEKKTEYILVLFLDYPYPLIFKHHYCQAIIFEKAKEKEIIRKYTVFGG